jgi:dephospho-CoA kinase
VTSRRSYVIGITGNIACGKSLVTDHLANLGAFTLDADRVAHELMRSGTATFTRIVERFGSTVVGEDGELDRRRLGRIVFNDPAALKDLDAITHPAVVHEILRRIESSGAEVAVIDAIKLYESGLGDECDETWAVICDPAVQIERLMQRNGIDETEARRRIDAQPRQRDKAERADRVIDNSGTRETTLRRVDQIWRALPRARASGERAG